MNKIVTKLIARAQSQGSDAGKGTIGLIIGLAALAIGALIAADAFGVINFGD